MKNSNSSKKARALKVYRKYFKREYKTFTVFPEIRLIGKWLKDVGFECGETIHVKVGRNKLVIEKQDYD